MQGLLTLYNHTGRRAEWKRLVEEIVPDFVSADDLPLSGREEGWDAITQYRMRLAMEERNLEKAEAIQYNAVKFHRSRASNFIDQPSNTLTSKEKNIVRWLGVALAQLGDIQREQSNADCVKSYQEAFEIMQRIGDVSAAVAALNLGHAYMGDEVPDLRNLDEAERWYHRSLELRAEGDGVGQAKSKMQLGYVARKRFTDAKKAGKLEEELLKHLTATVNYYQQALDLLPPDAVDDLAVTHNQLGNVYKDAGDLERALYHYNQDIHYDELAGNPYGAGITRRNIAIVLANNRRLTDALLYARAISSHTGSGRRIWKMKRRG